MIPINYTIPFVDKAKRSQEGYVLYLPTFEIGLKKWLHREQIITKDVHDPLKTFTLTKEGVLT